MLRHYTNTDTVMYALWNGYGEVLENADLIELPNRPLSLITGSVDAAAEPLRE